MGKYDFGELEKTPSGNCSIAFNKDYFIKVGHGEHPLKLRTLAGEIEVIKYLNDRGCVSCPKLISTGRVNGEDYFIQERVYGWRNFNLADFMFSMLEQKSFGVCQNDFKRDNLLFDINSLCNIIDYDQAFFDDRIVPMGNLDFLNWYDEYFVDRWTKAGFDFKSFYKFGEFDKEEIQNLFRYGAFNLGATTLLKEQITTNTESGFYHTLDGDKLYIDGARDLDPRKAALYTIDFREGEKVLDVGCNMGLLCHYLHDRGCRVTGIDMDKKLMLAAKMVANILGKDITFIYKDVDKDRINGTYDTICLFSTLHHLQDVAGAAANIASKCNRIILENRLVEGGSKPIKKAWRPTSHWEFKTQQELIDFCELIFKGFKFRRSCGKVDRDREILIFTKGN
jgi:2-polyprenyl-3-methyl-5-hydroxy-6-metoxy-1,4-benzoquinol methylase